MIALFSYRTHQPIFTSSELASSYRSDVEPFCGLGVNVELEIASSPARTAREMEFIRIAEQEHRPERREGRFVGQMGF